jgi:hypothetical protein
MVAATPARAERIGLGLGVEPLHVSGAAEVLMAGRNAAPVGIYLPIQLSPRLRLEPSAAYFEVHRSPSETPAGGSAFHFSATAIGFGALFHLVPPAPLGLYVGGRLTVAIYSGYFMDQALPQQTRRSVTETNLFFAPVVGGEFAFFRQRFAVGAEVQLPIAIAGDRSLRTSADTNTPNVGRTISTNTVLFLRYYF